MKPLRLLAELVGSFLIVGGVIGAHLLEFAETTQEGRAAERESPAREHQPRSHCAAEGKLAPVVRLH